MMDRVKRAFAHLGGWIDDLLFPEDVLCLCCDHALEEDDAQGICQSCARALDALCDRRQEAAPQSLPEGVDGLCCAMLYEAQARRLIHRLKYQSVRAAAAPLAARMALMPAGEEEIIVPVPTDRLRERRRGFNQATLLAQEMGRELGMEVVCALERVQQRRPQTGLNAQQRLYNLKNCMRADSRVSGRRVLLVDDVYTTGATVGEAARALRAAGAQSIFVFTAARASADSDTYKELFIPHIRR